MGGKVGKLEFQVYTGDDPDYQQRRKQQLQARQVLKDPQQPRCDDRAEDLYRVLWAGGFQQLADNLPQAWRVYWQCIKSAEG